LWAFDQCLWAFDQCLSVSDRCLSVSDRWLSVSGRFLWVSDRCLWAFDRCLWAFDQYSWAFDRFLWVSDRCLSVSDRFLWVSDRCLWASDPPSPEGRQESLVRSRHSPGPQLLKLTDSMDHSGGSGTDRSESVVVSPSAIPSAERLAATERSVCLIAPASLRKLGLYGLGES